MNRTRPGVVVEVRYNWPSAGRFRGTTKMLRWRQDREPESCLASPLADPHPRESDSPVASIVE